MDSTPENFLCAITGQVMTDPVITVDGHTYEREAIQLWLRDHDTSPMTNAPLESTALTPNIALRHAIDDWMQTHMRVIPRSAISYAAPPIGRGSFKTVYSGTLTLPSTPPTSVAVLVLRAGNVCAEVDTFLKLAQHPRLVEFLGQCEHEDEHILLTELAPLGSLGGAIEGLGEQMTVPHVLAICQQMCAGMEAIAGHGMVHGDLAIRNLLLFGFDRDDVARTSVKVCDYGLSAHMNGQTHVYAGGDELPFRHMPPEALQRRRFSEKSDVWAFGVAVWELLTLGMLPYFEHTSNQAVIAYVGAGGRLSRTHCALACPDHLWALAERCWEELAANRPSFAELSVLTGQSTPRASPPQPPEEAVSAQGELAEEEPAGGETGATSAHDAEAHAAAIEAAAVEAAEIADAIAAVEAAEVAEAAQDAEIAAALSALEVAVEAAAIEAVAARAAATRAAAIEEAAVNAAAIEAFEAAAAAAKVSATTVSPAHKASAAAASEALRELASRRHEWDTSQHVLLEFLDALAVEPPEEKVSAEIRARKAEAILALRQSEMSRLSSYQPSVSLLCELSWGAQSAEVERHCGQQAEGIGCHNCHRFTEVHAQAFSVFELQLPEPGDQPRSLVECLDAFFEQSKEPDRPCSVCARSGEVSAKRCLIRAPRHLVISLRRQDSALINLDLPEQLDLREHMFNFHDNLNAGLGTTYTLASVLVRLVGGEFVAHVKRADGLWVRLSTSSRESWCKFWCWPTPTPVQKPMPWPHTAALHCVLFYTNDS
eukprot:TRINITY_DN4590_c0_g1_i1.p1 TRINITY_DN4590_c0_g1~~TRINITY_DN4590_c0_g1_i1.p1  ORF type:complete len:769 (+),score=134.77 TRINITY_DN4590_c0_g1_i1:130-2436(+)